MKLRIYPDSVLRKKAEPVKNINEETIKLLNEMLNIMHNSKGIGLAASQIGILQQLIVIDIGKGELKLVNPKIIKKKGKRVMEEGCLSFPELGVKICRADKVKVKALNEKGQEVIFDAEELLATVLQHEIDHLKGKLIIDYVSWPKRWFLHKKLKRRKCVL